MTVPPRHARGFGWRVGGTGHMRAPAIAAASCLASAVTITATITTSNSQNERLI